MQPVQYNMLKTYYSQNGKLILVKLKMNKN